MSNATITRAGSSIFAAALLLAPGRPSATPVYYFFEGHVVHSTVASHAPGQSVNYTFLVDKDLDGQTVDGDGNVFAVEDFFEAADWYTLSFFASYSGGDALTADNPFAPLKESCNCGLDQLHNDEIFSALRGSNSDASGFDLVDVYSDETAFENWTVGQSLRGENFVMNAPGELNTGYGSVLTLSSITDYNPIEAVPEPSTLASFAIGALGLGALMKRRRRIED